jgi:geranylgeranyl pyrophosphate synthase
MREREDAKTTLSALLEEAFLSGDDADGRLARSVSRALWDDALLTLLRDFLARPSKGLRASLVELGYRLGGGEAAQVPVELPLLIECVHAGSLIIDDIEDCAQQRRAAPALHQRYGVARALNAGNWLYFWPQVLLGRLSLSPEARLCVHERLALCLLRCHEGQALDLQARVDQLAQREVVGVARAISRLKTGGLLGMAVALGAIAAGAPLERVEALAAFGREFGVGLQMLDDVSGVLSRVRYHKAAEDLSHARVTWVWAGLAETLDHSSYEPCVSELRERLRDFTLGDAGASWDPLIERLHSRLGGLGLRQAHRHVDSAVDALAASIGRGSWCDEVLAQFAWLEQRYVDV